MNTIVGNSSTASHYDVHRVYWLIKGSITSDKQAYAAYNGYFKRCWYEYEGQDLQIYLEGFDEAYRKKFQKN